MLGRVLDDARSSGRDGSMVEAGLLRALAHRTNGDPASAAADLTTALAAGVPAGYCRIFLDEGRPMAELLELLAGAAARDDRAREARAHAETLLTIAQRAPTRAPTGPGSQEALSERELDVLRLLATELSGPEIARRLFVSVNTLRTHTRHIFTKLDVSTRRAAVLRATQLGLL